MPMSVRLVADTCIGVTTLKNQLKAHSSDELFFFFSIYLERGRP